MTNEKSKINAMGGDNLSLPIGIRQRNHLNIRVNDKGIQELLCVSDSLHGHG
jgi:hypothetical protein